MPQWIVELERMWPLFTGLGTVLLATLALWGGTRFASRSEHADHGKRLNAIDEVIVAHDKRVTLVEEHCRQTPTRQDLSDEIAGLSERMRGVEVGLESNSKQLHTANNYLHVLVNKAMPGVKP